MGNIITDIVDEIQIKPNKAKLVIKWVVGVSITLITTAFVFGQFKASFFNKMDKFEEMLIENSKKTEQLSVEMDDGFTQVNEKIDKIYVDGFAAFNEFQKSNNEQLLLIIDYGSTNKDLLKRMIEFNTRETSQRVENQIQESKIQSNVNTNTQSGGSSVNQSQEENLRTKGYRSMLFVVTPKNDTIFVVSGATREYFNSINRDKYNISEIYDNPVYSNLINFRFMRK
jgi:hypothetical protein